MHVPDPPPGSRRPAPGLRDRMGACVALGGAAVARVVRCSFRGNGGDGCLAGGGILVDTDLRQVPPPADPDG
jgi:hypothetical protein